MTRGTRFLRSTSVRLLDSRSLPRHSHQHHNNFLLPDPALTTAAQRPTYLRPSHGAVSLRIHHHNMRLLLLPKRT